jgi:hypothetical protein
MRFMVMIKGDARYEAGAMPSQKLFEDMTAFNEELVKAGVMQAGEGLQPTSKGARVHFSPGGKTRVVDGPFAETKELVAGFWIWKTNSLQEAIDWARRIPNTDNVEGQVEIRQIFEAEDFGSELTPDLREKEAEMRAQIEANR